MERGQAGRSPEELRAPKGGCASGLVALDEQGDSPTSEEWAADIARARDAAQPLYAPDGLSTSLRGKARRVVGFPVTPTIALDRRDSG